jgi:hypothetical protein
MLTLFANSIFTVLFCEIQVTHLFVPGIAVGKGCQRKLLPYIQKELTATTALTTINLEIVHAELYLRLFGMAYDRL